MSEFDGLPQTENLGLWKPGLDNVSDIRSMSENMDTLDAAITQARANATAHASDPTAHAYMHEAKTQYVNAETGNDNADGLTSATAKRTIQAAVDAIPQSCMAAVINVAAGTYDESVEVNNARCGIFTITGPAEGVASVKSIFVRAAQYCVITKITITGDSYLSRALSLAFGAFRVDGVTITNTAGVSDAVAGVSFQMASALVINCKIDGFSNGIHAAYGSEVGVRAGTFTNNTTDLYAYSALIVCDVDSLTRQGVYGGAVLSGDIASALTAGNFLRLTGGTMTGAISASGVIVQGKSDDDRILLYGGKTATTGAILELSGANRTSEEGSFILRARNTTNTTGTWLHGTAAGGLEWGGKNIVRSVNGLNADDAGAVTVPVAPDYSAGVSMSSGFTAPANGVCVLAWMGNPGQYKAASINGVKMFNDSYASGQVGQSHAVLAVAKGDVVTFSVSGSESKYTFFPFK